MIISPPFLPAEGITTPAEKWKTDRMMDVVDGFEIVNHGVFPIAFDRRWHCGIHLAPYGGLGQIEPVRAVADGEVVAYRVVKNAITDGQNNADGTSALNSNTGFVLLKHSTETGDGRAITFYSLYHHLLDLVSTHQLSPQPNNPPPESSSDRLPAWLLYDSDGVKTGDGKKLYRKDRIGFVGQCHGQSHLHFEIFMTEEDFGAHFEERGHEVGLGQRPSRTPDAKDHWGRNYFVIPRASVFFSVPPRVGHIKTNTNPPKPLFPALDQGTLDNESTLYVETYFSRGERYMRSWIDRGDRKLVLLTPEPVQDKYVEYEYGLFERATALYPTCPSDGFDLLRFGRILTSDQPKLSSSECATWLAVPFDFGKMGYIDVNQSAILKLSDANFPAFMDWQKIDAKNTPFDRDGLCGYDSLCDITRISERMLPLNDAVPQEMSHDDRVANYVRYNSEARAKLKGFICHSRSEWDASWNSERFKGLNEREGFFGRRKAIDPRGYDNFIAFVQRFQFMEKTPFGDGKKFWFFHPLAFIRHFRRCGWLSRSEMIQMIPPTAMRAATHHRWVSEKITILTDTVDKHRSSLNNAARRYGIVTPYRMAAFYANAFQETTWLSALEEGENRTDPQRYLPWQGRGFLQLTWPSNYIKYWRFDGVSVSDEIEQSLNAAAQNANVTRSNTSLMAQDTRLSAEMKASRSSISRISATAADTAGAYWAWTACAKFADMPTPNVLNRQTVHSEPTGATSMPYYINESFGKVAATVNVGHASTAYRTVNGIVARFQAYTAAQVALFDLATFPVNRGDAKTIPEGFSTRRP